MKFAIFGKEFKPEFTPFFTKIIRELDSKNYQYKIYYKYYDFLNKNKLNFGFKTYNSKTFKDEKFDFILCIGGDGTIIDSLKVINTETPIIAINSGRLGFLTNIPHENISEIFNYIESKKFRIEERAMLECETKKSYFGIKNYAVNEFTIHKKDTSSMIMINTYIDGIFLNSYWADGLIVSTPTGSTAYSLSCNGPIVMPNSHNFIINPIAAHNLNVRPLVIPDNCEIKLIIEGREEKYLATLDSKSVEVNNYDEFIIKKSNKTLKLIQFPDQNFFNTIRNKLFWGVDKRN